MDDAASQTTRLYARLRAAILGLDMVPGERLTERGLESRFDASRTPARAALIRLEGEGLVQRAGRGWRVAPIDLREIDAVTEFREAVEAAAVRLAVEHAGDADVAALLELVDTAGPATDEEESVRAGGDFHVQLALLSLNPFFADAVRTSMGRLARTRWLEVRTAESRTQAWQEHRQVVQALSRRDADEAARLVTGHVRSAHARLVASLHAQRHTLRARGMTVVGGTG